MPIAKARRPLASVDPNEHRDSIGARGDGAVGARGAPARRARAKDQGDDRRALLLRATFERWREAGAAAKRERVAVREEAAEAAAVARQRRMAIRRAREVTSVEERIAAEEQRRAREEAAQLRLAAAGEREWPDGVADDIRAVWQG